MLPSVIVILALALVATSTAAQKDQTDVITRTYYIAGMVFFVFFSPFSSC